MNVRLDCPDARYPVSSHRLTLGLLVAAAILVVIAIGWLAAGHVKHMLAFLGVAAVCLGGAWFTSNPRGT